MKYSLTSLDVFGYEGKRNITVLNGVITSIDNTTSKNAINCEGYEAYPAFINSHEHLLGSYSPRVGKRVYKSWEEWDTDLKQSGVYKEKNKIANADLYLLGSYKNLLSGTLTVFDHIPREINKQFESKLPIDIVKKYAISHNASDSLLVWGKSTVEAAKEAKEKGLIFSTHLGEGVDKKRKEEFALLKEKNLINENTLLAGCVSLTDNNLKYIAEKKASISYSPYSNSFLYGKTLSLKKLLDFGINVCLSTDSLMSGSLNILEEMRFASFLYKKETGEELNRDTLIKIVSKTPASVLKLNNKGTLEKNKIADILVVRKRDNSCFGLGLEDIELIIKNGVPIYATEIFKPLLGDVNAYSFRLSSQKRYCIYDISSLILRVRKAAGYAKQFPFLPIE